MFEEQLNRILEIENEIKLAQIRVSPQSKLVLYKFSSEELVDVVRDGYIMQITENTESLIKSLIRIEREQEKSNVDLLLSAKSFGRGMDMGDSLSENTQDKYEIMAALTWNFDFGKHRSSSEIGKLLSKEKQAQIRKNQLEDRLVKLYDEINKKIKSNTAQIRALEEIKKKQKTILKIENKRFKNGKITTLDYVKAQEAFDHSQLKIINLNYSNELLAINMYKLLGRMDLYLKNRM